jgi:predicted dehydrogenase
VRFAACCDIRPELAEEWAREYGCDAHYSDYEEMIRQEELDGVLLATWPSQHREQIERCLAAGARNILCEKALTLTGREALEIWHLVNGAGAFLMEGFMYRHHPAIREMERRLATGRLGTTDRVRACFSHYDSEQASVDDDTRNWRQRKECGGGVVFDLACYCVNACQHFATAPPTRVFCRGDESAKYGTVNRLYGIIEYENGCLGVVESSKRTTLTQELQVACAQGTLVLPVAWTIYEEALLIQRDDMPWPHPTTTETSIAAADSYQLQLENFADVIEGSAPPLVTLAQSVLNTYTLEAVLASAAARQPIAVEVQPEIVAALSIG